MPKYPLKLQDVIFKAFRSSQGKGGQALNKTENCIRATHKPTGVVVEAKSDRSQHTNKENSIKLLQAKLNRLLEEKNSEDKQEKYNSQTESSFGSQIRTYRLCGNAQGVLDHTTSVSHPNAKDVLNGNLDNFIEGSLRDRKENL